MQKIIEFKNVSAYRDETQVFDKLSLEMVRGRNTVILGPNGAGKTTLLKLLARELYPRPNEDSYIRLFGQETWNVWELRAHLGIVSHDLQQHYAGHARGINVILSGYYASIDTWPHQQFSPDQRARAEHVMRMLGIDALKDKFFATMSTGEQRRFLLGRALVNDPETLLLDEPTSGLDIKGCFQYLQIIRDLMRAGKTLILVTHHIHEIPPEVTHVLMLKRGVIIGEGAKQEILTRKNLSELFDTPIELVQANGFYQVIPGTVRAP